MFHLFCNMSTSHLGHGFTCPTTLDQTISTKSKCLSCFTTRQPVMRMYGKGFNLSGVRQRTMPQDYRAIVSPFLPMANRQPCQWYHNIYQRQPSTSKVSLSLQQVKFNGCDVTDFRCIILLMRCIHRLP